MSVYRGSRYERAEVIEERGTRILSLTSRHSFNTNTASYYTFIQGDTIDGIAYKYYGNASYWWAIMEANPHYQSELDIKAGDILTIPSINEIEVIING